MKQLDLNDMVFFEKMENHLKKIFRLDQDSLSVGFFNLKSYIIEEIRNIIQNSIISDFLGLDKYLVKFYYDNIIKFINKFNPVYNLPCIDNLIFQKSPEFYPFIHFRYNGFIFNLTLSHNEEEKSGKYSRKKYIIPEFKVFSNEPLDSIIEHQYSKSDKTINLFFHYRALNPDEKEQFRGNYQKRIYKFTKNCLKSKKYDFSSLIDEPSLKNTVFTNLKKFMFDKPQDMYIFQNFKNHFKKLLDKYIKETLIASLVYDFNEYSEDCKINQINTIRELASDFRNMIMRLFRPIINYFSLLESLYVIKKFVYDVDYCIPLGDISSDYYDLIKKSDNLINHWDYICNLKNQNDAKSYDQGFFIRGKYFPINTSYLDKGLKYSILNSIDNSFDKFIILCIKGDNYQALNLITKVYSNSIDFIYIDPPYNTGNATFIYHDNIEEFNWLKMMEKRLDLSLKLLKTTGLFLSSIDNNEIAPYQKLIDRIYPEKLNPIIWQKKTQPSYLSSEIIPVTEYIVAAKKTSEKLSLMGDFGNQNKLTELINIGNKSCTRILPKKYIKIKNGWSGALKNGIYGKDKLSVNLLNGPIVVKNGIPNKDLKLKTRFKWTQQRIEEETKKGGIIHIKSIRSLRPTILRAYDKPIIKAPISLLSKKINDEIPTNTDGNRELKSLFQISPFDYSKPTGLIKYLIRAGTYYEKNSLVLDFFAGSGTTAHATLVQNEEDNGNRKCILIEKNHYFSSVIVPRLEKIMYSQDWKDGKPYGDKGFNFRLKYLSITDYEDCFFNITLKSPKNNSKSGLINYDYSSISLKNTIEQHKPPSLEQVINYEVDFEEDLKLKINTSHFKNPFNYWMHILEDGVLCCKKIDLVETFNYLLGISVIKSQILKDQGINYSFIFGTTDDNSIKKLKSSSNYLLVVWRNVQSNDFDSEKDRFFIENTKKELNLNHKKVSVKILVNSIKSEELQFLIEPIFLKKMFGRLD